MRYNRRKNMADGFASGLFNKVVMSVFPFIIRTAVIKILGSQYLGLNSLFISILNVLTLSELGFGAALVYEMYQPIAEDDEKKVCALLAYYKKIHRIAGTVILLIGVLLVPFLEFFIKGGCPPEINIYILYAVYLFHTVITYYTFAYKASLLRAHQRTDVINNVAAAVHIAAYSLQLLILVKVKNYYAYIIVLPIFTILNNLIAAYKADRFYPQYQCRGELDKQDQIKIFSQVKALFGHKLGGVLVNSTDNIILSYSLGLTAVALYNNYYQIYAHVAGIADLLYTSATAGIGNSIVLDSVEKNYKDFEDFTFLNTWIIMWCSTCMLCLVQDFMVLWMGKEYLLPMNTVVLFVLSFYIKYIRKVVLTYKDAAGMWRPDRYKPVCEGIVNLVLNLILVKRMGVNGIVTGTVIAMGMIGLPWEAVVLFKGYFKRSAGEYFIKIIKMMAVSAMICGSTFWLCSLIPFNIYARFILKLMICLAVPNILFVICFHRTKNFEMVKEFVIHCFRMAKEG